MAKLLAQEGIWYRGALSRDAIARAYWEARYWMLPLNRAESELFCLNAVKAMHCGAIGVVNRIGALQNTGSCWWDYTAFRENKGTIRQEAAIPALPWNTVIEMYWEPLF